MMYPYLKDDDKVANSTEMCYQMQNKVQRLQSLKGNFLKDTQTENETFYAKFIMLIVSQKKTRNFQKKKNCSRIAIKI